MSTFCFAKRVVFRNQGDRNVRLTMVQICQRRSCTVNIMTNPLVYLVKLLHCFWEKLPFKRSSHVAQVALKLPMQQRSTLNSRLSCIYLLGAGITGKCHTSQFSKIISHINIDYFLSLVYQIFKFNTLCYSRNNFKSCKSAHSMVICQILGCHLHKFQ